MLLGSLSPRVRHFVEVARRVVKNARPTQTCQGLFVCRLGNSDKKKRLRLPRSETNDRSGPKSSLTSDTRHRLPPMIITTATKLQCAARPKDSHSSDILSPACGFPFLELISGREAISSSDSLSSETLPDCAEDVRRPPRTAQNHKSPAHIRLRMLQSFVPMPGIQLYRGFVRCGHDLTTRQRWLTLC